MNIIEKIRKKQSNLLENRAITIAFIGDSVTQGCFECYLTSETSLETVFDYKSAYSTRLKELLNLLYPNVQFNIINAGISGDGATTGYERLERDVLAYSPDLCVVSFGLNDSCLSTIKQYSKALSGIFSALQEKNIETIFLTQNSMCINTSCHLKDQLFKTLSVNFSKVQNDGVLKNFMEEAKKVSEQFNVKVCDLYPVWEKLIESGVNVTELLANKLNHPIREIHYYMAIKLLETILFN